MPTSRWSCASRTRGTSSDAVSHARHVRCCSSSSHRSPTGRTVLKSTALSALRCTVGSGCRRARDDSAVRPPLRRRRSVTEPRRHLIPRRVSRRFAWDCAKPSLLTVPGRGGGSGPARGSNPHAGPPRSARHRGATCARVLRWVERGPSLSSFAGNPRRMRLPLARWRATCRSALRTWRGPCSASRTTPASWTSSSPR